MHFLRASLLWLIPAAFIVLPLARRTVRRTFAASTVVRWLRSPPYRASRFRRLPNAIIAAALALILLAAMDPVLPSSETQVQSRGLDIAIVLDLSSSMQETMGRARLPRTTTNVTVISHDPRTAPATLPVKTRLDATKEAIKSFITRRRDDRIGLIVFSDHAYVVSPLTFDYEYLLRYVDLIDDQILRGEGMTAIGDGVALANHLLTRSTTGGQAPGSSAVSRRPKGVVVLFTDGENNSGRDPLDVIDESVAAGIRVHMIGVDLERQITRKPEVQRLIRAVRSEGGQYFNASTARELDAASKTIDTVEKGFLTTKVYVTNDPVYQWFAVPGLLLVAAVFALRAIPFFVDQT